jgi:uncharacterized protein (UPF0210 family)
MPISCDHSVAIWRQPGGWLDVRYFTSGTYICIMGLDLVAMDKENPWLWIRIDFNTDTYPDPQNY